MWDPLFWSYIPIRKIDSRDIDGDMDETRWTGKDRSEIRRRGYGEDSVSKRNWLREEWDKWMLMPYDLTHDRFNIMRVCIAVVVV